jgi:FlaG/FlaF family flagellin (archaellin)
LPSVDGSSDDVYWVLTDIGWRIGGFWFCDDGLTVFWITVLGSGKTVVYVSFDDADRGSCVILSMLKIAAMVILASLVSVWFFPTLEVRSCFKKDVALFHFCLQMDEGVNRLAIAHIGKPPIASSRHQLTIHRLAALNLPIGTLYYTCVNRNDLVRTITETRLIVRPTSTLALLKATGQIKACQYENPPRLHCKLWRQPSLGKPEN